MSLTRIPISQARDLGKRHGARKVVILALDEAQFNVTTWGLTRAECQQLGRWAESRDAADLAADLAEPPDSEPR